MRVRFTFTRNEGRTAFMVDLNDVPASAVGAMANIVLEYFIGATVHYVLRIPWNIIRRLTGL